MSRAIKNQNSIYGFRKKLVVMEKKTVQQESRIERTDRLWTSFAQWRQQRIRKSLMRPLYQEALRSLFFVAILLIDTLFPLQLYESITSPFNIIASLVALGILLYVEVRCYNLLWGKNGRWSIEKYTHDSLEDHKKN